MKRRALLLGATAALATTPRAWSATAARFTGRVTQGGLVFATAPAGTRATLDGRALRIADDGGFVFGFGRDHAPRATLQLTAPDGARTTQELRVEPRKFDIQRIDGLPPRTVEPDAKDLARIEAEQRIIAGARARDTGETLWRGTWVWPVIGRISGVYGSQRILNGQPRRPHYGVDIAMPTGTPVVAPADAIVSVAHADMFFTGGTIILDHGHGVGSLFAHLSALDVVEGRRVRQGERIGRIGATGRATGAHLHWGMTWYSVHVDPALVAPAMPTG